MDKYERRTQKKKESIIIAATKLFKEKGYKNSSIREIANVAEVSQVSIYNYFQSKEALVKECASYLLKERNQELLQVLSSDKSFKEILDYALECCLSTNHDLLFEYFGEQVIDDAAFNELLKQSEMDIRKEVLVSFINKGKNEGVIKSKLSSEAIVDYLNITSTLQTLWTADTFEKNALEMYDLILYGLMGERN